MDDCDKTTKRRILPYQYDVLPGRRVRIVHPAGAVLVYSESQIQNKLEGKDITLRDLSAHERIMLEEADKVLKENPTMGLTLRKATT